jgi:hypothetical protein
MVLILAQGRLKLEKFSPQACMLSTSTKIVRLPTLTLKAPFLTVLPPIQTPRRAIVNSSLTPLLPLIPSSVRPLPIQRLALRECAIC